MDAKYQNQTESDLLTLLDNVDAKKQTQQNQYILLLKKQPHKQYSTLYITDLEENFWLRKITIDYVEELKEELKLKIETKTFIGYLNKGIKESCSIELLENGANLSVRMEIGQGLTMNCILKCTAKLSSSKDPQGYKIIMKLFLRQLYQSKQANQLVLQKQIQSLLQKQVEQKQAQEGKKDSKFANDLFNEEKKDINKDLKHRDLLNPNKKKRKQAGIKLSTLN